MEEYLIVSQSCANLTDQVNVAKPKPKTKKHNQPLLLCLMTHEGSLSLFFSMKFLYWNDRGIAINNSTKTLLNFLHQEPPLIICIFEPMTDLASLPVYFLKSLLMGVVFLNS